MLKKIERENADYLNEIDVSGELRFENFSLRIKKKVVNVVVCKEKIWH